MSAATRSQVQNLQIWNDGALNAGVVLKAAYSFNYFLFWNDGAVGGLFYPNAATTSTNFMMFMPL